VNMNILVYNPTSTVTKMTSAASHVLWDRAVAYRTRRSAARRTGLNGTRDARVRLGGPHCRVIASDAAYTQRYAL